MAEKAPNGVDYESIPLSRSEYIAAMVHLYRGELYRSNSWRLRLDNTTNWAVITTAGLLSFSFNDPTHSHWTLLLGLLLITVFLGFEARRFRFAHMWRSRVRLIEENFYGPILRRDPTSPETAWGHLMAEDMFHPRFRIGRLEALRMRLRRNYWAIYFVLLLAWSLKIMTHPRPIQEIADLQERLAMGILPWWTPLAYLGGFLLAVIGIMILGPRAARSELDYWVGTRSETEEQPIIDR